MMQKKQGGMTLISWVIIIAIVGVQAVAALRIVPVYLDFFSAKKILEEVKADTAARGATPAQLTTMIQKRLNINGLYDLQKDREAFSFEKTQGGTLISLFHEARGPIVGNLDFIVTYEHEVEVPNQ